MTSEQNRAEQNVQAILRTGVDFSFLEEQRAGHNMLVICLSLRWLAIHFRLGYAETRIE